MAGSTRPNIVTSAWGFSMYQRWNEQAVFTSNQPMATGYSLANLANRRLHSVARWETGTLTSVQITMDLSSAGFVDASCFMLIGNFSASAQVQVLVAEASSFASPIIDSGALAVYDQSAISGNTFTNGVYTYKPPHGRVFCWVPDPATFANIADESSYFRFIISDASNEDGYLQVSIADVGWLAQPSLRTMDEEWESGVDQVGQPGTGDSNFPLHKVLRWHKIKQSWLTESERILLKSHFLNYGPNGRILFLPSALSRPRYGVDALWCSMRDQPTFSPASKLSWAAKYQMEKIKFLEVDE